MSLMGRKGQEVAHQAAHSHNAGIAVEEQMQLIRSGLAGHFASLEVKDLGVLRQILDQREDMHRLGDDDAEEPEGWHWYLEQGNLEMGTLARTSLGTLYWEADGPNHGQLDVSVHLAEAFAEILQFLTNIPGVTLRTDTEDSTEPTAADPAETGKESAAEAGA